MNMNLNLNVKSLFNPALARCLAASVAALPLLVACGGGGGDTPVPTPVPAVTTAVASTPKYGQQLLLTVNGTNLDQAMTVSSAGCTAITRSTTAPNVSSATTAYYGCTVSGVGAQQFAITRNSDNASIGTAAYTVPVPQVTMAVSNGAAVSGSFVITLTPQQAPVTVNNFLAYVNSGYYNNSIFHRLVPTFVAQGGGYNAGVTATTPTTAHKVTNAAIVLEDNAGLSNVNLSVAMARTSIVDSATSEFFINLVDNPFLDRTSTTRGYAVFGSITSGASVVTAMKAAPCVASVVSECLPIPNLVITSATQTQ